jgi:hypothetical protein
MATSHIVIDITGQGSGSSSRKMNDTFLRYAIMASEIRRVSEATSNSTYTERYQKALGAWINVTPEQLSAIQNESRSPYNDFVAVEVARILSENPNMDHKEAFKQAAILYKTSSSRPDYIR